MTVSIDLATVLLAAGSYVAHTVATDEFGLTAFDKTTSFRVQFMP